jgi:hypothetical protein
MCSESIHTFIKLYEKILIKFLATGEQLMGMPYQFGSQSGIKNALWDIHAKPQPTTTPSPVVIPSIKTPVSEPNEK